MRVVVVGAGIVGASVAYRLAHGGAEVTVVDRGRAGAGTTSASFAWLNANHKTPRAYFDLNLAGMVEHRRLRDELEGAPWLHEGGMLCWAGSSAEDEELRRRAARLHQWGYAVEWWPAREVRAGLEPALALPDDVEVAFFPDEGWVDAPGLTQALLRRAELRGTQLHEGVSVAAAEKLSAGRVRLRLDDGRRLEADAVVNAAGTGAPAVARVFDRDLPFEPTTGLLVRLHVPGAPLARVLRGPRLNIRPDGQGHLLAHMEDIDERLRAGENRDDLVRELVQRTGELLPSAGPAEVTETMVGTRPIPEDGFPSLGAVAVHPGYYEAVTHSGVTLGPLLGRLLAAEILEGKVDALADPFRPDRF